MAKPSKFQTRGASVSLFRTKTERAKADKLRDFRQTLLAFSFPPHMTVAEVESRLEVEAQKSAEGWRFMLMDPGAWRRVTSLLDEHSARPAVARRFLEAALERLDSTSQQIRATQTELGREIGEAKGNVSVAVAELERLRVIWREPAEKRGHRLFLNPWLATKLGPLERQAAQAAALPIGLDPVPQAPRPPRQARAALRIVAGE